MSVYRENEKSGTFHNNAFNSKEFLLACDNDEFLQDKFKYLFYILYSKTLIDSFAPVEYQGKVYLQVTCLFGTNAELFETGTRIFLNGIGYANILDVDRSLISGGIISYTIDLDYNNVFLNMPDAFYLTIPHSIDPTPGYLGDENIYNAGYINIAQDLRTKVSSHFYPYYVPYLANETVFNYSIAIGYESKYEFNFTDNALVGGNVAFVNPTLSVGDLDDVPFKIGDEINIQQDLYEWVFTDNLFSGGNLAFTNSNPAIIHNFREGQQVFVTGQITEPANNGYVTVAATSITDTNTLITDKTFITSTPVEGGSVFGVPRPEYNTVTTVKDIYYDGVLGVVILTHLAFTGSSQPISGTITYADSTFKNKFIAVELDNEEEEEVPLVRQTSLSYFNTEIFPLLCEFDEYYWIGIPSKGLGKGASFQPQVLKDTGVNTGTFIYKCAPFAISYVLIKGLISAYDDINFIFEYSIYDNDGVTIDTFNSQIAFSDINRAWYFPLGYASILAYGESLGNTFTGTNPASIALRIQYYDADDMVYVDAMSPLFIEVDQQCPNYKAIGDFSILDETYYIIFRDSMGSYLSIPCFNKSIESKETTTSTYYKNHRYVEDQYTTETLPKVDAMPSPGGSRKIGGAKSEARGRTNLYKRSNNKVKLNTAFLTDQEVRLVTDMIDSSEVYIQKGSFPTFDEESFDVCQVFAAQLLNTEVQTIKRSDGDLAQYSFDFSMSIDNLKF